MGKRLKTPLTTDMENRLKYDKISGPEQEVVTPDGSYTNAFREAFMSSKPIPRYTREQAIVRFWAKVERSNRDSCWLWKRTVDGHGYGQATWDGKHVGAHRLAYLLKKGPIPQGMCVLHSCDNPLCVNPNHLFLGTMQENTQDMMRKGRNGCGRMPGEANPFSKLTEDDVRRMKTLYRTGNYTKRELAKMFNVTETNACYILNGKAWKHVQ